MQDNFHLFLADVWGKNFKEIKSRVSIICWLAHATHHDSYLSIIPLPCPISLIDLILSMPDVYAKIESTLFVPENLSFSEYLRCLNFPLWTFWPAKTKQCKESNLFRDKVPTRSGKFKHLKYSVHI